LSTGNHKNQYLQNAWIKYGSNKFEFSILEIVSLENQYIKEQEYLNTLNPFPPNGYNIERQAFKGAESPHKIIKHCKRCGIEIETYRSNTMYCKKCGNRLTNNEIDIRKFNVQFNSFCKCRLNISIKQLKEIPNIELNEEQKEILNQYINYFKICRDCGEQFVDSNKKQIRCPECRRIRRKEYQKRRKLRLQNESEEN
jgi:ribosomal protein L21